MFGTLGLLFDEEVKNVSHLQDDVPSNQINRKILSLLIGKGSYREMIADNGFESHRRNANRESWLNWYSSALAGRHSRKRFESSSLSLSPIIQTR